MDYFSVEEMLCAMFLPTYRIRILWGIGVVGAAHGKNLNSILVSKHFLSSAQLLDSNVKAQPLSERSEV